MNLEDVLKVSKEKPIRWLRGSFDPLLPAHARRVAELALPGTALVVRLIDSAVPLLPARARAELVAALRDVDYVVLGGRIPEGLEALNVDDLAARCEFLNRVRGRHHGVTS